MRLINRAFATPGLVLTDHRKLLAGAFNTMLATKNFTTITSCKCGYCEHNTHFATEVEMRAKAHAKYILGHLFPRAELEKEPKKVTLQEKVSRKLRDHTLASQPDCLPDYSFCPICRNSVEAFCETCEELTNEQRAEVKHFYGLLCMEAKKILNSASEDLKHVLCSVRPSNIFKACSVDKSDEGKFKRTIFLTDFFINFIHTISNLV